MFEHFSGTYLGFKCKMSLVCPTCGKNFSQTSACDRHIRSVHENPNGRQFKCSICKRGYKRRDNLQVHMDNVHAKILGKMLKQRCPWPLCNYYGVPDYLKIHLAKIHIDDREPEYSCKLCSLTYYTKRALRSHERREHGLDLEAKEKQFQNCKRSCPLCKFIVVGHHSPAREILFSHFRKEHNVNLKWQKFSFDTLDQFYNWKQEIENQTTTSFLSIYNADLTKEKKGSKLIHTYRCNRSGYTRTKENQRKYNKHKRSGKINAYCPAVMKVRQGINKEIQVMFLNVHLGHKVSTIEGEDPPTSILNDEKNTNNNKLNGSILEKLNESDSDSSIGSRAPSIVSDDSDVGNLGDVRQEELVEREVVFSDCSNVEKTIPDHMLVEEQILEVETTTEKCSLLKRESTPRIGNNFQSLKSVVEETIPESVEETKLSETEESPSSVNCDLSAFSELKATEEQVCSGALIAVEIANNLKIADILQEISQMARVGKLKRIQLIADDDSVSDSKKYLYIKQDNKMFSKFEEVSSSVVIKIIDQ